MRSYTNARPGAGLLLVDLDRSRLSIPRIAARHLADAARPI
jgi:hypothetical protein